MKLNSDFRKIKPHSPFLQNMKKSLGFDRSKINLNSIDLNWIRDSVLIPYIIGPITRLHPSWPGYEEAVKVMDEDWDILIILDACRADVFENSIDMGLFDHYERKISLGSHSREWVEKNFQKESYGDTVYISTNPHTNLVANNVFHKIIELWDEEYDDELGTVSPEVVAEKAKSVSGEYPNKRIIVHFMQPHGPLIGSKTTGPYESNATYWKAYTDTLEYAFPYAKSVADNVKGKTIITADHGQINTDNALNFLGVNAHKRNVRLPGLVEVPWAVINDDRREVVTDKTETGIQDNVDDRLRDLGYKI